jgi:hypothetical protein
MIIFTIVLTQCQASFNFIGHLKKMFGHTFCKKLIATKLALQYTVIILLCRTSGIANHNVIWHY